MITTQLPDLPRPIVFVFGGGAASTSFQVGMAGRPPRSGLRPDLIVGTSAGALNGVLLADDPENAVGRLTEIWTRCTRSRVVSDSRLRVLRNLLGGHFMYRNRKLRRLFTEHMTAQTFDELGTRFACVATDLDTGDPVLLHDGPLVDALLGDLCDSRACSRWSIEATGCWPTADTWRTSLCARRFNSARRRSSYSTGGPGLRLAASSRMSGTPSRPPSRPRCGGSTSMILSTRRLSCLSCVFQGGPPVISRISTSPASAPLSMTPKRPHGAIWRRAHTI